MRLRTALVGLGLLALVGLAIGGDEAERDLGEPVSYASEVQLFFNQQCVACHLTGAESGGLNLEPGLSHEELLEDSVGAEMPRVTPGDPEESYLFHKLRGTHLDVGGSGVVMPQGGQVSDQILAMIERWIAQGAPAE